MITQTDATCGNEGRPDDPDPRWLGPKPFRDTYSGPFPPAAFPANGATGVTLLYSRFTYFVSKTHVAAPKVIEVAKMPNQENPPTHRSERKARRWWAWGCSGLMALAALKIYYVREMIAALVIFSVLFAIVAIVVLVVFILYHVAQWAFAWAESCAVRLARWAASLSAAIIRRIGLSGQWLRINAVRWNWLSKHS